MIFWKAASATLGCNRVQTTHFRKTIAATTREVRELRYDACSKKRTVDKFVDFKTVFYLCTTMALFAGSYDTTTHATIPWQVATQGAIDDSYT